ncbi:hypothetical protein KCU81_g8515, partial [Aureobasidium melanogenum]
MAAENLTSRPVITATNHSAFIFIATALCLVCMLLFLSTRLVVRYPWKRSLGPDDWTTLSASVCALCQSVVLLSSAKAGLGKAESELSPFQLRMALELLYVSDLLYIPSMFLAQLAVSLFFLRLSGPEKSFFHRLARFIAGASMVFAIVCFLMIAIRVENGVHVWEIVVVGHRTILHRWIAAGVLSILIEILLIICPAWLLWTLHMPTKKKLGCAIYFGLRFPTIMVTIFRLLALVKANRGVDRTFDMTVPAVLTQLEMHFTVLAATIPILRNPLTKLNSGYLNTTLERMDPVASAAYASSRSGSSGKGPSFALSQVTGSGRRNDPVIEQREGEGIETTAERGSETIEEGQNDSFVGSSKAEVMLMSKEMVEVVAHAQWEKSEGVNKARR